MLHCVLDGRGDGAVHDRDGALDKLDLARVGVAEGSAAGEQAGLLHFLRV